ncbi:MAG: hypothetical protein A2086_06410 [Spirochaetes bacterium GWD1_27_9]|nr:MAG: hypothetical protein A2Z98_00300 [Spirochaetes bacterium GWB1_27_13]OHD27040.1 MAG: hypothetical protein A2Y34_18400 [Spirochaetes bacterium GWC1_27_15]OHD40601.1 MAG: hypothetical protein A2086_06410 [Spirochaetes bacterium GWD1_27_9]
MPSEKQKIQKKVKKPKKFLFFFLLSFILVVIFTISFFLLYIALIDVPFQFKISKKTNNETLLKLAEEAYNNGFLENSSVYYKNYLNTNPDKLSKIKTYERLFEISINNKKQNDGLYYLKQWQQIEANNPIIYINRLKLYLKDNDLGLAKKEIDSNYAKLKKSVEFKELVSVYFFKTSQFENALKELEKIQFNKREFSVHKKLLYCYIYLDKLDEAIKYIKKIESKIKLLELKEHKLEFVILKSIVFILRGEIINAYEELNLGNFPDSYNNLSLKLFLYCNIILDKEDDVKEIIEKYQEEINIDSNFSILLGDYFIFKGDYQKALLYYEKIKEERALIQNEVATLADIYYKLGEYQKSIEEIQTLNKDFDYKGADLYKNISVNFKKLSDFNNEFFYLKEGLKEYPEDMDFYVRIIKSFIDRQEYNSSLKYINETDTVYKNNKNIPYDKRLDVLKVIAIQQKKDRLGEKELLDLREKGQTTPEYYFKLIEFYIKNKKFVDAKREIDTVLQLPLNESQYEAINVYILIYASYTDSQKEYDLAKKNIMESQSQSIPSKINLSIIYILEEDYNKALDILNTVKTNSISSDFKKRILYLKAILYYYKEDFPAAYKLVQNVLEIDSNFNKAAYLKSLIYNSGE